VNTLSTKGGRIDEEDHPGQLCVNGCVLGTLEMISAVTHRRGSADYFLDEPWVQVARGRILVFDGLQLA
jgi:hypothetical protein